MRRSEFKKNNHCAPPTKTYTKTKHIHTQINPSILEHRFLASHTDEKKAKYSGNAWFKKISKFKFLMDSFSFILVIIQLSFFRVISSIQQSSPIQWIHSAGACQCTMFNSIIFHCTIFNCIHFGKGLFSFVGSLSFHLLDNSYFTQLKLWFFNYSIIHRTMVAMVINWMIHLNHSFIYLTLIIHNIFHFKMFIHPFKPLHSLNNLLLQLLYAAALIALIICIIDSRGKKRNKKAFLKKHSTWPCEASLGCRG